MPLRVETPFIALSEASEYLRVQYGASLETEFENLVLQGALLLWGHRVADAEASTPPEDHSKIEPADILYANWCWESDRLSISQEIEYGAPDHLSAFVRCGFPREGFETCLKSISGRVDTKKAVGRPTKYDKDDLLSFLEELDVPRGVQSQGSLAGELQDLFRQRRGIELSNRQCQRLVRAYRPKPGMT
jgi:hypothetical protein